MCFYLYMCFKFSVIIIKIVVGSDLFGILELKCLSKSFCENIISR